MVEKRLPRVLQRKRENVLAAIERRSALLVAMSGGVDSTLLASLAKEALGKKALAVTIDDEAQSREEMLNARRTARSIGIRHITVPASVLTVEKLARNPPDRCYLCKSFTAKQLWKVARKNGIRHIADGVNADDAKERRPGIRAADKAGIWHPLKEAGFTKADIRALAAHRGLGTADRPSAACLMSRVAFGDAITAEVLRRIERAEAFLRGLGLTNVRARCHGDIVRIEVPGKELGRILRTGTVEKVVRRLKKLGFSYVTMDLEGYRPGSMDSTLPAKK